VAPILEEIKGLGFKNKKPSSFGCYGWSGEAVKILNDNLEKAGFLIIIEGSCWVIINESKIIGFSVYKGTLIDLMMIDLNLHI
jgi:hypothetical protein